MIAWTDYPIRELGDIPYTEAPIRQVNVLSFDTDKYCLCRINDDLVLEIKAWYLYRTPGRLDDTRHHSEIHERNPNQIRRKGTFVKWIDVHRPPQDPQQLERVVRGKVQ